MQLKDKIAVVLGASERGGTGWAIARQLAADGAKVVVSARRAGPLEELAKEIGGFAIVCDGGKKNDIATLAKSATETFGKIDIAVNCAFAEVYGLIDEVDEADLQRSLDVNFIGQVHFVRYMAQAMNDGGSIILISSAAAAQPMHGGFAYGCAKAATDSLVRYAALEYGPRRIRVNSILPGPIRTTATAPLLDTPAVNDAFMLEIPLGRLGVPQDYAEVVAWLSRPGFITGANIPVSGGMQLNRVPRLDRLTS